ncbi:unnamed protein product [Ceutorhynchus assimilis]|uniref:Regulatory protein zeste n=1 Tax=Ceutorhynchus assimilis TaxID=467358 RepID=A0A9N9QHC6_9CUCU|nr:unnamed protein product [Ceutorhynchus assimilis]
MYDCLKLIGLHRQLLLLLYLKMRVRPEHWALLLQMCEKNPEIITDKFKGPGKAKVHAVWEQVTQELNGLGFGKKSAYHWRKTLIDWKCKTKNKAGGINRKRKVNDDKTVHYVSVPLSEYEKKLLSLMGTTSNGNDVQKMGFKKINQSWEEEEEHLTLIVHSDDSSELPPSIEESFDVRDRKPNEHDYNALTYPTSAEDDYCKVKISSDVIKPSTDDHNYNRPTCSTGIKRPPKRQKVRPRQGVKVSNRLTVLSQKTLQTLKNIDKNTQSIAESLKVIADAIKAPVQ